MGWHQQRRLLMPQHISGWTKNMYTRSVFGAVAIAAFFAPQLAQAGEGPVTNGWLKLGAAYGKVPAQPSQFPGVARTFVPVATGAVALTNSVLSTPSGPLAIVGRTGLSTVAIGTAAARCLMLMNPYCAGAAVILTGYEWLRVKPNAGGLVVDMGAEPPQSINQMFTCTVGSGGPGKTAQGLSPEGACITLMVNYAKLVYADPYYGGPNGGGGGWGWQSGPTCPRQTTDTAGSCIGHWSTSQGPGYIIGSWTKSEVLGQGPCPAYVDALDPAQSSPAGSPTGYDGKCKTGRYAGISPVGAAGLFRDFPKPGQSLPDIARDAIAGGETVDGTSLPASGPATTQGAPVSSTTTTNNPPVTTTSNGTTTTTPGSTTSTTTTTTPTYTWNYAGDQISYDQTTTTQTCVGTNACTSTTAITTTSTQVAPTAPAEPVPDVCLTNPNSTMCKPKVTIDESGTPTAPDKDPPADVDGKTADARDAIANPTAKWGPFPTISWSFSLPTACGPIAIPAFSPWLTSIDICPFQEIFHNIMSMVWIVGGLFGAIGVFWRDQLATP